MRAFLLVAGAALAISACGPKQRADNAVATGDNLAAEAIIANDTTAIDAATGDAANMAADVAYTISNGDEDDAGAVSEGRPAARRRSTPAEPSADNGDAAVAETPVDSNLL